MTSFLGGTFLPRHADQTRETSGGSAIERFATRYGALWSDEEGLDPVEQLGRAGLDFQVSMLPVYAAANSSRVSDRRPSLFEAHRHRAMVRDIDSKAPEVLGVASSGYHIVQNRQLLDFGLQLSCSNGGREQLLAAAQFGRPLGTRVMLAFKLMQLDDSSPILLLLTNSHDGSESLRVKILPIDQEHSCHLVGDLATQSRTISHATRVSDRMSDQIRQRSWIPDWIGKFARQREALRTKGISTGDFESLVFHLWPEDTSNSGRSRSRDARTDILVRLFLRGTEVNFSQTAWAAFISVCEYLDQHSDAREANDLTSDRDERLLRGAGDKLKVAAWRRLQQLVQ
jgi:Domain of unknown function (DUF932)